MAQGIKGSGPGCAYVDPDTGERCPHPHQAKTYCKKHYARWRAHGDPHTVLTKAHTADGQHRRLVGMTDRERFEHMIDRNGPVSGYAPHLGPCWVWLRRKGKKGYAEGWTVSGKTTNVHRWSYEHFVGPIPAGLQIDHLCRVKHCQRPSHLEPVTAKENNRRMREALQMMAVPDKTA